MPDDLNEPRGYHSLVVQVWGTVAEVTQLERIGEWGTVAEVTQLEQRIGDLICPARDHDGLCPIPWETELQELAAPDAPKDLRDEVAARLAWEATQRGETP